MLLRKLSQNSVAHFGRLATSARNPETTDFGSFNQPTSVTAFMTPPPYQSQRFTRVVREQFTKPGRRMTIRHGWNQTAAAERLHQSRCGKRRRHAARCGPDRAPHHRRAQARGAAARERGDTLGYIIRAVPEREDKNGSEQYDSG